MTIGKYETVRLLGKGGMSEVYEAVDPRLGTRHAVKVFAYAKDDDSDVRRRFETEGRLLAKLNHPRIVRVTDFGTDESSGRPYFVMDLVLDAEGSTRSLADVEPGTVDEETVGRWYDDLRDGLAYIHANGIVHRDLKLQNVLIGPDGHAVLTDFGVSKVVKPEDGAQPVVDVVNTIVKMREGRSLVMGSIGYMAPELEMGVAASPQSDWYALGVIVFRLLTGTWCDARTDVVAALETYDPAWRRVLPKLLHANPQGRECLSFAEEKRAEREAAEFASEARWLREKSRGHLARHVARYVGGVSVLLALALAWCVHELHVQREVCRLKIENAGARPDVPSFDELFRVPVEARGDTQYDDNGDVAMPSRGEFEAAWLDALVLTHRTLASLRAGDITLERAISELESMRRQLEDDSDSSPFDDLHFGDADYIQFGDNDPLRRMFDVALEKLQEVADR